MQKVVEATQSVINTLNEYTSQSVSVAEEIYNQVSALGYEITTKIPGVPENFEQVKAAHTKVVSDSFATARNVYTTLNEYTLQGVDVAESVYNQLADLNYQITAQIPGAADYVDSVKDVQSKIATETFASVRAANSQMKAFTEEALKNVESLPKVEEVFSAVLHKAA